MNFQALNEQGWTSVDGIHDDSSLERLANSLGTLANDGIIAHLSPKTEEQATSRSLSYRYGLGRFPMHTDTAFWPLPARYVVLRAQARSTTDTLLLPFPHLMKLMASSRGNEAIFVIRTSAGSYYGNALFKPDPIAIRFDPCHMKCANPAASALAESLAFPKVGDVRSFSWSGTNALVIDNWRCLHGRSAVSESDENRRISRLYVTGGKL